MEGGRELIGMQRELKNSLNDVFEPAPKTIKLRSEAKGVYHAIHPDKNQKLLLFNHFQTIGADTHLISDSKERNAQILHKWFKALVVTNNRFPSDLPVNYVLDEFFEAILHRRVVLKGFNLAAHMEAFHKWIEEYERKIRAKHWHNMNPEARPKELAANATISDEEAAISDAERVKQLKKMYGDNPPPSIQKWIDDHSKPKPK